MSGEHEGSERGRLLHALLVYAEPLVDGARVLVLGDDAGHEDDDDGGPLVERLHELGARHVQVHRTSDDLDTRDGTFDVAIVADLGMLQEPTLAVRRLRRMVTANGAVVALARAHTADGLVDDALAIAFPEVAPPAVSYSELYDLFALEFESVSMTGVLPFAGVVFAQLGTEDDVAVGVDTRLAAPASPTLFVVVASRERYDLDPYAIVQLEGTSHAGVDPQAAAEERAALAAALLEARLLAAQLDEQRVRNARIEAASGESAGHVERLGRELDVGLARAAELEATVVVVQQALALLESRLVAREQQILERDDAIAALRRELEAAAADVERAREDEVAMAEIVTVAVVDPSLVEELTARADRAAAALALNVADLGHVAEAHATETAALEEQLRERAGVITAMEKELARREHLVRELVTTLDEAREAGADPVRFEAVQQPSFDAEQSAAEIARLQKRIDDLAFEIARREGELVAQAWRIQELETEAAPVPSPAAVAPFLATMPPRDDVERELARTKDELDALRQALTQEHAARVAAESGEELSRARAELAQQATLLEQMKARGSHPEG